ncbi:MAG: tetratricopeptide repeat protein [Verrucomicrobiales bacterium]|nr:tetratricopeptide repeat protein [Verrucomicrobiales bacterium]
MPVLPTSQICRLCHVGYAAFVLLFFTSIGNAENIVETYNKTVTAIGNKEHEKALILCNKVIKEYGLEEGKKIFGPVHGHWYYLRGLCMIAKDDYEAASSDFEICYNCAFDKPFIESTGATVGPGGVIRERRCKECIGFGRITPKGGGKSDGDDGKITCPSCGGTGRPDGEGAALHQKTDDAHGIRPNTYRMHALVQWGNCQMVLENYTNAKLLYEKALTIDVANRLNFNWKLYAAVNMGRCMLKTGATDEGYNYIIRALDAERFPLPIKLVVFQILANDWTPEVSPDLAREFLDQYRYIPLSTPIEERAKRNPDFFFLANDAAKKNDPLLALSWYRMIAHPGQAIAELDDKIERYEARKKSDRRPEIIPLLDEEIAEATKTRNAIRDTFWSMQAGLGIAHYQLKNYSASFSIYKGLSDFAPKSHEGRPEFLHNAIFSAVQINDWKTAYEYGMTFLDEFPNHQLKPAVVRVLVEMIFIQGNYQKAYEISKEVRKDMEPGSEMREIPDFVVGASAFQLGNIDEAETELTKYLGTYDPAQRKEPAMFFLGSVKTRKSDWPAATSIFDQFLDEFPQSAMTSSVLYQNGMAKYMMEDNETALTLIDRLHNDYPDAPEGPGGWNLRADINSMEEADFDTEISPALNQAITTSKNFAGQEEISAYAMWQMMVNLAGLERWEEAGQWIDRFEKEHPDSVYAVDLLIGSLETLVALNRVDEASQKLEALLYKSGGDAAGSQLAELFGTYLDFIKENDPDNAPDRLEELSLSTKSSAALQAWAKIGKIQVLEDAEGDNQEAIQTIFYQLNNNFDPSEHSNYIIVRLARWHSETRNKPADAAPLYDYILENREGSEDFDLALLDRAQIDAKSALPEDRSRAMMNFNRVLNEFGNAELAENANVGVARLLTEDGKYEEALPLWEAYMENNAWNKFSAEANYNYGLCLDKLGQTDEALVVYINTYNAFPGYVEFSTLAYLRSALIMKGKGEDLKALLILKDMLTRMQKIEHPNKKKALQLFTKWRAEYVPPTKEAGK